MGKFNHSERKEEGNLSLDKYMERLRNLIATVKVRQTMNVGSCFDYVLVALQGALQDAIDIAQGKVVSNEDKVAVLKNVEELTKSALSFHNNKFAQIRENTEEQNLVEPEQENKNEGHGLGK